MGKALWHQSRDITVWNYSNHLLFAIPVNGGTLSICQNKSNEQVEWVQTKLAVQVPVPVKLQEVPVNDRLISKNPSIHQDLE
jgi:hypothetical protein